MSLKNIITLLKMSVNNYMILFIKHHFRYSMLNYVCNWRFPYYSSKLIKKTKITIQR
ncbi:hypothetical protein CMALT394_650053 [Carnobacterium maltaromaticum]|nr:hypothetical protein CMALT394_650053 [Carnobacterium maltaromaticum]